MFDAIDTDKRMSGIIYRYASAPCRFKKDSGWKHSAKNGFTNATDAADYLVNHGVPFRDAHGIVGQLVLILY